MSSSTPKITCHYYNHPLGQLHYRYIAATPSPTPKPPILCLHKSASSSASFTTLMTHFSTLGHTCYAPDMPGFGNSFDPSPSQICSQPTGILETTWYVNLYAEIFRDVIGSGKWHIIGHHSGAGLALELGVRYSDLVESLVLVGASIMNEEERMGMKEIFFSPFNTPELSGSHLLKTWNYLLKMGPFTSPPTTTTSQEQGLQILQREFLDHARAWQGRNQIYGAIWNQDSISLYKQVKAKMMVICARDDVLWEFFHYVKELREDVRSEVLGAGGGNFTLDFLGREVGGLCEGFWKDGE